MREEPTLRIPMGVLALFVALLAYALAPVYVLLGVVWLLPLKWFLIWMETGRWG